MTQLHRNKCCREFLKKHTFICKVDKFIDDNFYHIIAVTAWTAWVVKILISR